MIDVWESIVADAKFAALLLLLLVAGVYIFVKGLTLTTGGESGPGMVPVPV